MLTITNHEGLQIKTSMIYGLCYLRIAAVRVTTFCQTYILFDLMEKMGVTGHIFLTDKNGFRACVRHAYIY